MGIRIKIVIGYGLDDIETDASDALTDPRINRKGYFFKEEKFTRRGLLKHFKNVIDNDDNPDKILLRLTHFELLRNKEFDPYQCMIYDGEYGFPNIMCFIPPSEVNQWKRDDDVIDYYLSNSGIFRRNPTGNIEPWYQFIDRPLYPFDGYMDKITGERCRNDTIYNVKLMYNEMPNLRNEKITEEMKEKYPFAETWSDINERYVPMVPKELTELLKYCKVFTNDEVIHRLRPMIYCYWS